MVFDKIEKAVRNRRGVTAYLCLFIQVISLRFGKTNFLVYTVAG